MTDFTYANTSDELDGLAMLTWRLRQEAAEHAAEFEELERQYAQLHETVTRLKGALKLEDEPPVEDARQTVACPRADCGAMLKFTAALPFVSLCRCRDIQVHVVGRDGVIVATEMALTAEPVVTRAEFMAAAKITLRYKDDFDGRRFALVVYGDWAHEVLTYAAGGKRTEAAGKDAIMTLAWARYCSDKAKEPVQS